MSKLTHETLAVKLKELFNREANVIVQQLMDRGQSMTSEAFADFELEVRETLMSTARKHAKSCRGGSTIL